MGEGEVTLQTVQMTRLFVVFLTITMVLVGCKEEVIPEHKECYYCKETDIKYWAKVCKHCEKDPNGPNGVKIRMELQKDYVQKKKRENDDAKKGNIYQFDLGKSALLIAIVISFSVIVLDLLWCKYTKERKTLSVSIMTAVWVWLYKVSGKELNADVGLLPDVEGGPVRLPEDEKKTEESRIVSGFAIKCWNICFSSGIVSVIFYWVSAYIGEYSSTENLTISRFVFSGSLLISTLFLFLCMQNLAWNVGRRVKWCLLYIIWSLVFCLGFLWIWNYVYFDEVRKLRASNND